MYTEIHAIAFHHRGIPTDLGKKWNYKEKHVLYSYDKCLKNIRHGPCSERPYNLVE